MISSPAKVELFGDLHCQTAPAACCGVTAWRGFFSWAVSSLPFICRGCDKSRGREE
jgi:hypothetical protein